MRSCKHISVDRADGQASYDEAVRYLRDGEVVGVFPEATISRSFLIKELKTGAVRMAADADVPLVPTDPVGHPAAVHQGPPASDFSRHKTITVTIGEPLDPQGATAHEKTQELHAAMSAMLDKAISEYPRRGAAARLLVAAGVATAAPRRRPRRRSGSTSEELHAPRGEARARPKRAAPKQQPTRPPAGSTVRLSRRRAAVPRDVGELVHRQVQPEPVAAEVLAERRQVDAAAHAPWPAAPSASPRARPAAPRAPGTPSGRAASRWRTRSARAARGCAGTTAPGRRTGSRPAAPIMLRFACTSVEDTVPTSPPVRTSTVACGPLRSSSSRIRPSSGASSSMIRAYAGWPRSSDHTSRDRRSSSRPASCSGFTGSARLDRVRVLGETVSTASATTRTTGLAAAACRTRSSICSPTSARVIVDGGDPQVLGELGGVVGVQRDVDGAAAGVHPGRRRPGADPERRHGHDLGQAGDVAGGDPVVPVRAAVDRRRSSSLNVRLHYRR